MIQKVFQILLGLFSGIVEVEKNVYNLTFL